MLSPTSGTEPLQEAVDGTTLTDLVTEGEVPSLLETMSETSKVPVLVKACDGDFVVVCVPLMLHCVVSQLASALAPRRPVNLTDSPTSHALLGLQPLVPSQSKVMAVGATHVGGGGSTPP